MAVWQGSILSSGKTHENTLGICNKKKAPKGPSDSEKQDYLVWWSSIPKHHVWRKPGTVHHMQSIIPKVKCAGSSLMMCGAVYQRQGLRGLVRVEEKLNAPKYRDNLNENSVQSIQILRLGRRFTLQQDNEPKHTARVAYRQLCECSWVVQPQPELEPNQIFLEKPEHVRLPHPTWQSLRGEEVRRRMADYCQMLMSKACRIKQKRVETVKVLQLNI